MSHHDTVTADIHPDGWRKPAVMRYANTDTVSVKEAALVLRYGPEVSPQEGVYIIAVESPSGAADRDTLRIALVPDPSVNKLRESRIPYRTDVTLGEEGEYVFTVIPPPGAIGIWSAAIDFKRM